MSHVLFFNFLHSSFVNSRASFVVRRSSIVNRHASFVIRYAFPLFVGFHKPVVHRVRSKADGLKDAQRCEAVSKNVCSHVLKRIHPVLVSKFRKFIVNPFGCVLSIITMLGIFNLVGEFSKMHQGYTAVSYFFQRFRNSFSSK